MAWRRCAGSDVEVKHKATGSGLWRALVPLLARRLVQALAVALIVATACFFIVRQLPGDLAYRIAAARYGFDLVSTAAASGVRAELGLDRAWWLQLLAWWAALLRGELGASFVSGEAVWHELAHELGHTLMLSLAAIAMSLFIGPPLGLFAGLRPGGWVDHASLGVSVLLRTLPPFLLSVLLLLVLSVQLDWLGTAAHGEHGQLGLPALTLALGLAAGSCRVSREAMRAVAATPMFEFARTKGLSDLQALWRHGLRNAAVPVVAYVGVQLVFLIEGVVVVETLFAWPGIGHALVHAVFHRDVPVIQGAALLMALLFVGLNTAVDLACLALDPRRRR